MTLKFVASQKELRILELGKFKFDKIQYSGFSGKFPGVSTFGAVDTRARINNSGLLKKVLAE